MSIVNECEIAAQLKTLLDGGLTLGDSLRKLHDENGIGLLWLTHAVKSVTDVSLHDAQHTVIQETTNIVREHKI